jgi:hypothetical protein
LPRVLEEGISELAAKELLDKALTYINPALGEDNSRLMASFIYSGIHA